MLKGTFAILGLFALSAGAGADALPPPALPHAPTAPTVPTTPVPATTLPPLGATYTSLAANVFKPKCATCHSGAHAAKGIDLSSYNTIVKNPVFSTLVVPSHPADSVLLKVVSPGANSAPAIMPPGSMPKLTPAQVKAVSDWIKAGAKNT